MSQDNPLTPSRTNDQAPMIPGIGVSGTVLCPFGFQKSPCLKNGCELWVELDYDGIKVGRCSLAWMSLLSTEVRASIDKLVPKLPTKETN